MNAPSTLPLAVSVGDPAGIGPDVILKSWSTRDATGVPPFYVIADPEQLRARADAMKLDVSLRPCEADNAAGLFRDALPVVPLEAKFTAAIGAPDTANATGIIESIDRAVGDAMAGRAGAVVTAPIAKKPLYEAGFRYPGHTEYLAALAEEHTGQAVRPVMMLAGPKLRAVSRAAACNISDRVASMPSVRREGSTRNARARSNSSLPPILRLLCSIRLR